MSEQKIEVKQVWRLVGADGVRVKVVAIEIPPWDNVFYRGTNHDRGIWCSKDEFRKQFRIITHADGTPVEPESEYEELPVAIEYAQYGATPANGVHRSLGYWKKRVGFEGFKYTNGTVSPIAPLYRTADGELWTMAELGDDYEVVWPESVLIKKEKQ